MDDNDDNKVVRIVPRCEKFGLGGAHYTVDYALMQVSTRLYLSRGSIFNQTSADNSGTYHFAHCAEAEKYVELMSYKMDTTSELAIHMSRHPDSIELTHIENNLRGAFFAVRGELNGPQGPVIEGVLFYYIPADVGSVRLHYVEGDGWLLCEEVEIAGSLLFTGSAWKPNLTWPENCVSVKQRDERKGH